MLSRAAPVKWRQRRGLCQPSKLWPRFAAFFQRPGSRVMYNYIPQYVSYRPPMQFPLYYWDYIWKLRDNCRNDVMIFTNLYVNDLKSDWIWRYSCKHAYWQINSLAFRWHIIFYISADRQKEFKGKAKTKAQRGRVKLNQLARGPATLPETRKFPPLFLFIYLFSLKPPVLGTTVM